MKDTHVVRGSAEGSKMLYGTDYLRHGMVQVGEGRGTATLLVCICAPPLLPYYNLAHNTIKVRLVAEIEA